MNQINFNQIAQTIEAMQNDPSLALKSWQAQIRWENGVRNQMQIREFEPLTVDEPIPLGGTDQAPNPVEYLIGAAASCFAITFEVLASQKGIVLEEVSVGIDADLNAAVFLGLVEGDGGILEPKLSLNAKTSATIEEVREVALVALSKSPVVLSLNTELDITVE